jgi:hypothetical protein
MILGSEPVALLRENRWLAVVAANGNLSEKKVSLIRGSDRQSRGSPMSAETL